MSTRSDEPLKRPAASTTRVAIHGFGRIGRQVFKAIWAHHRADLEVVAIGLERNDEAGVRSAAHLLKYDSNRGVFAHPVRAGADAIFVGGQRIAVVAAPTLAQLPWRQHNVDLVIEATGVYTADRQSAGHLEAGADRVVISAPSDDADFTMIYGVNDADYDPAVHHIVSAGSDTTNALAMVIQALQGKFQIQNAMVTTTRAYTNAQKLLDAPDYVDLRRARSAPTSIVPTTTRAAAAIGGVFPELAGRVSGYAVCVPVPAVSILELVVQLAEPATTDALNAAFREAAKGPLRHVLAVSDAPLVSSDYLNSPFSATVDAPLTMTIGPLAKISAWYDNEWGYSNRVADVTAAMAARSQ